MAVAVMTAHTAGDEEFPTWLNNFIFSRLIFSLSFPILFYIFHICLFHPRLLSPNLLCLLSQVSGWQPLHSGSRGALQLQTLNPHVSLTHTSSTGDVNAQIVTHRVFAQTHS